MKLKWVGLGIVYRLTAYPPVKLMLLDFGGGQHEGFVSDLGYVLKRGRKWKSHTYGSINAEFMGEEHTDLDEAKKVVEQQALLGIALNKLTRSATVT
jgi:hypothetical protein